MLDLNSIGRKCKPQKLEGNGLVVECLTQDRGTPVLASPASLRCVLEQDTLILAKYWFQPRKTRPYIAERLLMGRKESNQANKECLT